MTALGLRVRKMGSAAAAPAAHFSFVQACQHSGPWRVQQDEAEGATPAFSA